MSSILGGAILMFKSMLCREKFGFFIVRRVYTLAVHVVRNCIVYDGLPRSSPVRLSDATMKKLRFSFLQIDSGGAWSQSSRPTFPIL
ncbi:MAG: hypothetical protein [Circoviridae sp.]|nr:MAG: hypothetical protein [Circoviridae sp.]